VQIDGSNKGGLSELLEALLRNENRYISNIELIHPLHRIEDDATEIVSHEGAWLAGIDSARPGIIMPGELEVGYKYYQEIASGIAEDRAEIISLNDTLETPAGEFTNVLKTEETNPLEPEEKEFKYYAPGIGLIQEETLQLVNYTSSSLE
jgi:hypothetical protein